MAHCHEARPATADARQPTQGAPFEWFERQKAQVRAIVEHPFRVIKNLLGNRKVSCLGIDKNEARTKAQAALANLHVASRRLMTRGVGVSAA